MKNGKKCILCRTRKRLIQFLPEEEVRQNFINTLVTTYGFPIESISSEIPLTRYAKGKKGRADIVVSVVSDEEPRTPLIIIECKAPGKSIRIDKVIQQAIRYNNVLSVRVIVLTNGEETVWYGLSKEQKSFQELKRIPTYIDLFNERNLEFIEVLKTKPTRIKHNAELLELEEKLQEIQVIGDDTPQCYYSIIANISGLLNDENNKTSVLPLQTKILSSDNGLRYTTFGNAAGGSWTGYYRYFVVENSDKESEIVSLSIMGGSNGASMFIVAIDDFESSHNSLQYAIDRFIEQDGNKFKFWHDGTLTLGNRGRVKNQEVVDYISKHGRHLIKDGRIYLGEIDNSVEMIWDQSSTRTLIANFIDYGFLRDQFRKAKKVEFTI